jgi:hypothetical protein
MSKYNAPDRDAQGTALDKIKHFANLEITREDQATVNCGIFTDLSYVCNYIGVVEKVKPHQAYLGLAVIGLDRCYHEYKANNDYDIFTDIGDMVKVGMLAIGNLSLMGVASESIELFHDVKVVKLHTTRQAAKITSDLAKDYGIRTSNLHLYHSLKGLEYIVNNEQPYINQQDEPLFEDALRPLRRADRLLEGRRDLLKAWMGI